MSHKKWIIIASIVGVLACLLIVIWPMAPVWQRLGGKIFCVQGEIPDIKLVECAEAQETAAQVTALPLPTPGEPGGVPLIVDDDGSPDGLIALLYFLRNPQFDVRAATVSYGEAHPQVFAAKLAQLLAAHGHADIPVGYGRDNPLEGKNSFPEDWRQASDNFWGLSLPTGGTPVEPVPAAELMVETIKNSEQPVVVFVSGAHTNLAEALRLAPEIAENIRAVYIMGGAVDVQGNIEHDYPAIKNSAAEWNIWVDPQAASEVFSSGLPLHLIPLDATRQVEFNKDDSRSWSSADSNEGDLAGATLQMLLDSWGVERLFVWDLVAAVQATNPALCSEVPLALSVETAPGETQGDLLKTGGNPNVSVCLEPDAAQVRALAKAILGR